MLVAPQMAAIHCFLELEPVDISAQPAAGAPPAPHEGTHGWGASADACWAFQAAHKKQQAQAKLEAYSLEGAEEAEEEDDEDERCTASPGCSFSGAAEAALAGSQLELEDDACSTPSPALVPASLTASKAALTMTHAAAETTGAAGHQSGKQVALPDSTALVAATFFDDLQAKGSVYQYCLQR